MYIQKKLWLLKIPTSRPHVLRQLELSADLTTRTYLDCRSPPCSLVSQFQRQVGCHLLPFVYYCSSYGWVKKRSTTSCAQIWKGRWQNIMRSTSSFGKWVSSMFNIKTKYVFLKNTDGVPVMNQIVLLYIMPINNLVGKPKGGTVIVLNL